MTSKTGQLFHLAVAVYYICIDYHLFTYVVPRVLEDIHPIRDNVFTMAIQFATVWAQVLQQVYFFCCLADDALQRYTHASKWPVFKHDFNEFTHSLFTCFTFPFSIIISINFWILYNLNPLHLDPFNALFEYISRWVNHVIHTHIVPLVLIEICLNHRRYPPSLSTGFKKISWTVLAYLATVLAAQPFCSIWVYPFYGTMTAAQVVFFFGANLVCTNLAYMAGHTLSAVVWGKQPVLLKMVQVKRMCSDFIKSNKISLSYFGKLK